MRETVAASTDTVSQPACRHQPRHRDYRRCKLATLGRHTIVFGVGGPVAELMFVGEAGRDEDQQGFRS